MFYDCIKYRIGRAVVAFVSWIFHYAIETHECWFTEKKMFLYIVILYLTNNDDICGLGCCTF